jgi:hypothetical protein
MTRFIPAVLGLSLLVVGSAPAFASAEAPVTGPARPLVAVETTGGNGDAAPSFGPAYASIGANPQVRIIATGQRFDVVPLALAGSAAAAGG